MPGKNVPIINISPLVNQEQDLSLVAREISAACRQYGFFYIVGHGIEEDLQNRLEGFSRIFFKQPEEEKMKIRMALGGKAWRGYFPVGKELTSGLPDLKEGLYFGSELGPKDTRVQSDLPMHGANLFPQNLPDFGKLVLRYMDQMTRLGHLLMEGIALSLGLPPTYFIEKYTYDPLILFRIFHYPPQSSKPELNAPWGVGEHTDYGVLTILKQDHIGGLQIKSQSEWVEAPFIPNSFVCNIGDMLDRMTGGYYRSTPHRVKNTSNQSRYSFPFFFDPNFEAEIEPIELAYHNIPQGHQDQRWDGEDVHAFKGTYGDYILNKVSKVFPELR